ncbi:hypothetical protein AB0O57_14490 [Streptomyces sp. NPDC091201]|uniref:hypothetical protein n=1 Tax=Streptomyces sp. NPDC091201 TaxID=3155190 RepID=UPI00341695DF
MPRTPGRAQRRRRLLRLALLGLGGVGLLLCLVMPLLGLGTGDSLASVLSLFVSLAAFALALVEFLRTAEEPAADPGGLADDLARIVRGQWLEEADAQRLRDPGVLPLSWSATRRAVGDRSADPARLPAGAGPEPEPPGVPGARTALRVVRVRLDGRLDGRFDEAAATLATGYRLIGSGRLVVLGEPGAGKSVVALMLTLGLLADGRRPAGGPVPVLLPVSSWDPVVEPLDEWLVRRLAETYYAGRPEIPRALLLRGLLLPVLDGLDEIPESSRRTAVVALNEALGGERRVVVTCRAAEYEDVILAGSDPLARASVVEISPVAAEDAISHLSAVRWPPETDWNPVYEELRERPAGPVAAVLSTPLMVSVARTVYERGGGSPGELADAARFPARHAVEDHLMDRFLDAVYSGRTTNGNGNSDGTGNGHGEGDGPDPGPDAERARAWLTYLALYLHRHHERDLAWWLMPRRLLSPWTAPGVAFGLGALMWFLTVVMERLGLLRLGEAGGATVGGGFALLAMITWYVTAGRAPGRPSFTLRGAAPRLRRGLRTGFALTAVPAGAVVVAMALVCVSTGWDAAVTATLLDIEAGALALVLAVAAGLAVHELLVAPPGRAARSDPTGSLREDRTSALAGAVAGGAVVGLAAFPLMVLAGYTFGAAGVALRGWRGDQQAWSRMLGQIEAEATRFVSDGELGMSLPLLVAGCLLLPAVVAALLLLLSRSWTRFALLRLIAAARGQLPWRLMAFLSDAHDRGVLRQSAGTYRFRHVRLQEALVGGTATAAATAPPEHPAARRLRRPLLVGGGALAAVCAVLFPLLAVFPADHARVTLITPHFADDLWFEGGDVLIMDTFEDVSEENAQVHRWNANSGSPGPFPRSGAALKLPVELFRPPLREALPGVFDTTGAVDAIDPRSGLLHRDVVADDDPDTDAVLRWGRDGHPLVLLGSCTGPLDVWDLTAQRALRHVPVLEDAQGCDGELVLSGDGASVAGVDPRNPCLVAVWSADTGRRTGGAGSCEEGDPAEAGIRAVSHDGKLAAFGWDDGRVQVWDTRRNAPLGGPLTGHAAPVYALAFDATGTRLASAGYDARLRIWEVPHSQAKGRR